MATTKDPTSAARIRTLLAEREIAVEQKAVDRITAIDKELAGHGYEKKAKPRQTPTSAPADRQAPVKEEAAAEPVKEEASSAPADDKSRRGSSQGGKGKA